MTKQNINDMTLAYTSPENIKYEVEAPNKKSDIYALAITAFEIISNFSSAWHGIIPVLKDIFLMNAVVSGKRPNVNHLLTLYGKENINVHKFISFIQQGWGGNPSLRPTISVWTETLTQIMNFVIDITSDNCFETEEDTESTVFSYVGDFNGHRSVLNLSFDQFCSLEMYPALSETFSQLYKTSLACSKTDITSDNCFGTEEDTEVCISYFYTFFFSLFFYYVC
nr:uncharacterized protein LOC124818946 isoform X1 [Hydra vulgaris]